MMEPRNEDDIYLAGERVPPGRYRRLDSSMTICLEREGDLPASLDGHVACYMPVRASWSQFQQPPHRKAFPSS